MFFIFSSVILTGMNHVAAYRAATANFFNHQCAAAAAMADIPFYIIQVLALLVALV